MKQWYAMQAEEALRELGTDAARGLAPAEVEGRRARYGRNVFEKQKKQSILSMILHQLREITTIILLLAAVLSLVLAIREGHGYIEPAVIFGIVVMNMALGITQERSAEKALEALQSLNSPTCIVLREGVRMQIDTADLVPGDIILLKTGDLVPADARLTEAIEFAVDEASLTGESEPSEKNIRPLPDGDAPLGDQGNMVFSGCLVTRGNATAVVTAIGMKTEIGRIAGYLNNEQKIQTPLQLRLNKIGKAISIVAIASAAFLFFLGLVQGQEFWQMMLLAVSLAVAAVPETLSLIVTLTLTHGVKNMVQKHALIRKLPAVETLGSTSVICSDKTGTLTQNRMTIRRLWMPGGEPFGDEDEFTPEQIHFMKLFALAGSATAERQEDGTEKILGDPTETAILRLLMAKGFDKAALEKEYPKVGEIPFSSERKMMTVVVKALGGGYLVLTKGAFDRLPLMDAPSEELGERDRVHDAFAGDAMRILALGTKKVDALPEDGGLAPLESDLHFEGIIGLIDPPRKEAAQAIRGAERAGVRTVMITGDHAATASAIAKELGILRQGDAVMTGAQLKQTSDEELVDAVRQVSVYARVSPEDKLRIVEAWQENGEVVAMTGDGVNDAPALKAADVGVAMGINGTEVAKSASDVVLTNDNFATIVDAVGEGRNVFANIRKTIYFLLVCNLSEILIMLGAQLIGWGVPLTPVMLLLINVVGDGIPGLQLAKERSDGRIMDRAPIGRDESFFGGGLLEVIIQQTLAFTFVGWIAYYVGNFLNVSALAPSHAIGQTMTFLAVGWTSILHIFTVRSRRSVFRTTVRDNIPLVVSAFAMIALFALLVLIPPVGAIFGLVPIGGVHWLVVIGLSVLPTLVAEYEKLWEHHKEKSAYKNRIVRHRDHGDESAW